MHVVWTGERVRLRPFASLKEGLELVARIHAEPVPHWGPRWARRIELAQQFEDGGWCGLESCVFAVDRLDEDRLIGYEYVWLPPPGGLRASLATYIEANHRRRGFGVEAKQLALCFVFENFPIERVGAVTLAPHQEARRGLLLSGMQLESYRYRVRFSNGRFVDKANYVIFREQWEKLPIRRIVRRGRLTAQGEPGTQGT